VGSRSLTQPWTQGVTERVTPREVAALAVVIGVAALSRFVDLPTRGMWDADQGHDLLVLLDWVRGGIVPLVGPPTSIGELHHGAAYYWLLAPSAFASDADPVWVVATIALGGVGAAAVVWWLGRAIGGPIAGLVAAGLMAISAAAIEASTFIWNPNLIGLSSAIALAGGWQAWRTRDARWWLLAAAGQAVTMQLHVLGAALAVPLLGLLVADVRRRPAPDRRAMAAVGLGAIAVTALAYAPLIVHELQHGFPETRAVVDVLAGRAGTEGGPNPVVATGVIALRALSWPLAGLLTDAPLVTLAAAGMVAAILVWRAIAGAAEERRAARWFAATVAWSVIVLGLVAPGLATVTPGLPNDHYHAFLGPIVFVAAGLGVAALWRTGSAGRVAAAIAVAAVLAWNVSIWPPRVAGDGGYPAADQAARRISNLVVGPYVLVGLPAFKPADAIVSPMTRLGLPPWPPGHPPGSTTPIVMACDRLFRDAVGADCGGPAEDAAIAGIGGTWRLVDRFDQSARTSVSIYRPAP